MSPSGHSSKEGKMKKQTLSLVDDIEATTRMPALVAAPSSSKTTRPIQELVLPPGMARHLDVDEVLKRSLPKVSDTASPARNGLRTTSLSLFSDAALGTNADLD
jgi:hypothetical protein